MRKITRPNFTAEQFTATKFNDGKAKARFANKLTNFIVDGFPMTNFDVNFYRNLSNTFSFIAHYDRNGFYDEKFSTIGRQIRFVQDLMAHPCYGDPAYTFSDVEKAIKAWLRTVDVLEVLINKETAAVEAVERAQLARLQAKYPAAPSV